MKNIETKKKTEQPATATALVVIGWLTILVGFIAGIALGQVEKGDGFYTYTEFSFAAAMVYWGAGIVSGTMFIGMGKIIELLTVIANKEYKVVEDVGILNQINDSATVSDSSTKE